MEHAPHISDLTIFWINFLIYIAILYKVVKKPALNAWQKRREEIRKLVINAEKQSTQAQKDLTEAQSLHSRIKENMEDAKKAISAEAQRERIDIISQAQNRAEFIIKKAHESVGKERLSAKRLLQKSLLEQSFSKAEQILKSSAVKETDLKLLENAFKETASITIH